jgi:SAM-dependent methyltransferase
LRTSIPNHYYEEDSRWREAYWTPAEAERAADTVRILPENIHGILDVGCGAGIVTRKLAQRYSHVVASDRAYTPLLQMSGASMKMIQSDASLLPFPDCTFDAVVATELIEHLTESARNAALREIRRVSKRFVLLSVPYRETLEYNQIKCGECGCIFNSAFHTRSFSENDLRTFGGPDFSLKKLTGIGPAKKRMPRLLVQLGQIAGGYMKGPTGRFLCPQCGNNTHSVNRRNFLTRLFIGLPSRIAPLPRHPLWMAGLYERNNSDKRQ